MASDCLSQLKEEITHTDAFPEDAPAVEQALAQLQADMKQPVDQDLLVRAVRAAAVRMIKRNESYDDTVRRPVDKGGPSLLTLDPRRSCQSLLLPRGQLLM